jgi:hypothetical protein
LVRERPTVQSCPAAPFLLQKSLEYANRLKRCAGQSAFGFGAPLGISCGRFGTLPERIPFVIRNYGGTAHALVILSNHWLDSKSLLSFTLGRSLRLLGRRHVLQS